MCFAAQYLFTGEILTRLKDTIAWEWLPRETTGVLLLLLAVVLAAWSGRPDPDEAQPSVYVPHRIGRFAVGACGLAVALNVAAIGLFVLSGESSAVRILWVLSVCSLILPLLLHGFNRVRLSSANAEGWARWEGPALLALTLIGFLLRFYRVTEVPEHADNDVALMGVHTLRILESGDPRWLGLAESDHLLSSHQLQAFGLRLFGADYFGLVLPSVLAGTLTLPVLYLLARDAFSRRVALISTALLAAGYTHIHFSRILFGPIATFFLCLSFALVFRAMRSGRALWWALGGLAMGVSLLTYYSSRVGPVIVLTLLASGLLRDRATMRAQAGGWGLFLVGAFTGFGPMTGFVIRDFQAFVGRGTSVMIWSPGVLAHSMTKYRVDSVSAVLFEQVRRTFLTLHLYGDESPHFALPRPMVGAVAAALCVLGVGLCLTRLRRAPYVLVVSWVILTFVLGGVLTADPPYWPHLNIALPAVALLGGLGADRLTRALSGVVPGGRVLGPVALAAVLIAAGVHNWIVYYRFASDNAGRRIEAARFLATLPQETQVFLVADQVPWAEYCFQFFNRGMAGRNVTPEEILSRRVDFPRERPYAVVLFGHEDLIPALSAELPSSHVEAHTDRDGALLFSSVCFVPPGFMHAARTEPARPGLFPLVLAAVAVSAFVLVRSVRGGRPSVARRPEA